MARSKIYHGYKFYVFMYALNKNFYTNAEKSDLLAFHKKFICCVIILSSIIQLLKLTVGVIVILTSSNIFIIRATDLQGPS